MLWIKCKTALSNCVTRTEALSQAPMKGQAACLKTMIPVTSFHMGWPDKHSILLPFSFYRVRDGQGRELGDKDMGNERAGCGKRDTA